MTDSSNENTNNQQDNNLPEWLSQFRQELNNAKNKPARPEVDVAASTKYDNPNFKSTESIMMPVDGKPVAASGYHPFAFMDLAGYTSAVNSLRNLGIGGKNDKVNDGVMNALNRFHGVSSRPAVRPILLVSDDSEEIEPLLQATIDEFEMPTVRLELQEAMNGLPAMSVTANKSAVTQSKNKAPLSWISDNGGLLILDRIEDWEMFFEGDVDEMSPFGPIKLSPVGSEVISLVEKCSNNPQVQILCTTCDREEIPYEMYEMLGQVNEIVIDKPTTTERVELWNKLSGKHPSLRGLNNQELADLTDNLSRHDLEMIAQDAVSEAYQSGLQRGACKSVTRENVFEKIILRQDKNSESFHRLEEALVSAFSSSFDI